MTQHTTDRPRNIVRTYHVRIYARYEASDSTAVYLGDATVAVGADAEGRFFALRNGVLVEDWGREVLRLSEAIEAGHATLISEERGGLTKPQACALHRELGRLGVRGPNHYLVAAAVVGRPVASLTEVLPGEVGAILAHAQQLAETGQAVAV